MTAWKINGGPSLRLSIVLLQILLGLWRVNTKTGSMRMKQTSRSSLKNCTTHKDHLVDKTSSKKKQDY